MSDRLDEIRDLLAGADDVFEPELRADMEWLMDEVDRLRAGIAVHAATTIAYGRNIDRADRTLWKMVGPDAIDEAALRREQKDDPC